MQRYVIIVAGPEKSATRLVTRIMLAAGCVGDAGAKPLGCFAGWPQRFDVYKPRGEPAIVLRRSLPYHPRRSWPDLDALSERWEGYGYEVRVVATRRNQQALVASQVQDRLVADATMAEAEIARAYREVADWIIRRRHPAYFLQYEDLVRTPLWEISELCRAMGLGIPDFREAIFDGNQKRKEG